MYKLIFDMNTKHIVLCGGSGSRLKGESLFDKPLGLVLGI